MDANHIGERLVSRRGRILREPAFVIFRITAQVLGLIGMAKDINDDMDIIHRALSGFVNSLPSHTLRIGQLRVLQALLGSERDYTTTHRSPCHGFY